MFISFHIDLLRRPDFSNDGMLMNSKALAGLLGVALATVLQVPLWVMVVSIADGVPVPWWPEPVLWLLIAGSCAAALLIAGLDARSQRRSRNGS
jgi:hypothetical protein